MALAIPFLSTGPRVLKQDGRLILRTSFWWSLFTLFICQKETIADPRARAITHSMRYLWLFKKTWVIPFDQIYMVQYKYLNMDPFGGISANDSIDNYAIVIERQDHSELLLHRWMGQGEFGNNSLWPDWCYWDEFLFDVQGTQWKESVAVYEILRNMVFPREVGPAHLYTKQPPMAKPPVQQFGGIPVSGTVKQMPPPAGGKRSRN